MIALAQAWRAGLTRRTQRTAMVREAVGVRGEPEPPEHHELTARELIRMAQSARAATEARG
ncbi:hypothetical protein [Methylobacterium platani]|uniref:Uncharacterized protein n=2 Tax=Methylobacterium platani TaxID=427683 RepID=A0A179SH65_9HYPH|nr:hypothetical protein [Methylobacterium platani]KMO14769.1 hypothetical protein SQ03_18620 [Methylobacterium platani JCM 14648]OAS27218.1 hypothetical protein A5481_01980 [Methylobacterium platani]